MMMQKRQYATRPRVRSGLTSSSKTCEGHIYVYDHDHNPHSADSHMVHMGDSTIHGIGRGHCVMWDMEWLKIKMLGLLL